MKFIDLNAQYRHLQEKIDARIKRVLEHGQFIMGPEVAELEERLAAFVGVKHCISMASGTDALLVALMALGIKAGDEVITTPFTFFASAEVIALLGATPVFVDIDADTYNLSPTLIEAAITPQTKAIMPVSLYGQCADMDAINAVAEQYQLPVIEDAAQSFGATYHGKRSCSLSTIGCTSFFPAKPLGCYGDGGACFTNDDKLALDMRQRRVHGQRARYDHASIGITGRLDTLQAAILLEKLAVYPEEMRLREELATYYDKQLADHVKVPLLQSGCTSVYAQYTIAVENREAIQAHLAQHNIPTAVHYPKVLYEHAAFAYLQAPSCPVAEQAARRVLSLPMHPYMTQGDRERIAQAVLDSVNAEAVC